MRPGRRVAREVLKSLLASVSESVTVIAEDTSVDFYHLDDRWT